MFDGKLRIPEGFASLGHRQLNAIMANTRFFKPYGRNAMESWFDRAQTVWMADVPPPGRKAWSHRQRPQHPELKPQPAAVGKLPQFHLLHLPEGVVGLLAKREGGQSSTYRAARLATGPGLHGS